MILHPKQAFLKEWMDFSQICVCTDADKFLVKIITKRLSSFIKMNRMSDSNAPIVNININKSVKAFRVKFLRSQLSTPFAGYSSYIACW